ncbi:MAG TPA: hypothetical protein VI306_03445 [Pyrinomonadaceae bacterium]
MAAKKDQHTVGSPEKKRGQQMGFAGNPDQNREEMKQTPAVIGNRPRANKLAGDVSQKQLSTDAVTPSTSSPSTTGMNVKPRGAAGGAAQFKRRLAKKRAR